MNKVELEIPYNTSKHVDDVYFRISEGDCGRPNTIEISNFNNDHYCVFIIDGEYDILMPGNDRRFDWYSSTRGTIQYKIYPLDASLIELLQSVWDMLPSNILTLLYDSVRNV